MERKHACDQCIYASTEPSKLKRHKQSKHEGVRYPCDQCEYIVHYKSNLSSHKRRNHAVTEECGVTVKNKKLAAEKIEPEPVHVKPEPELELVKFESESEGYDTTMKLEVLEEDPLAGF